ncbi:MAG: biotin--[acetyl-CoA-carboxylase] ligase [Bacteroidales bacterium]|jgi:BirA family biotin operon repressor/biotin-[acetyl-CoA-carboxylase] ligase|nr:biotin--[acetyl-CoA-carboxylase] ligase [Bacteroidales bacterium]
MIIIELKSTDSTNNFAKNYLQNNEFNENILIFSYSQTAGRGNASNKWHCEDNKNIIFSLICKPKIKAEDFYLLNICTAISVCKYLKIREINAKIKWPNDIYCNDKKICGILIENSLSQTEIENSIIGIGLNLNETNFPENIPNPISLKNITNIDYNIKTEILKLTEILENDLKNLNFLIPYNELKSKFVSLLYRYQEFYNYKTKEEIFSGKIIDVEKMGNLVIETETKEIRKFAFKEVEFLW